MTITDSAIQFLECSFECTKGNLMFIYKGMQKEDSSCINKVNSYWYIFDLRNVSLI